MIQQVNLYKDILKQKQNAPNLNLYWISASAVILLFAGASGNALWQLENTKAQVQNYITSLEAEQNKVNSLLSRVPNQEIDTQLVADVEHWQNMLNELTQTFQLISSKVTEKSPGFSDYFQALSNQSIPDVWLRTLYFNRQQQIINIEGSTFKPEKVPLFLQQLQNEPIFNGHTFAKLNMQKSQVVPDQIDFKLTTTVETVEKK